MCGYCTESAALAQLLEEVNGSPVLHDRFLYPIYLQEAVDWRAELASWAPCDYSCGALVALCRQWSERIAERPLSPCAGVQDAYACIAVQDSLTSLDQPPRWRLEQGVDGSPLDLPSIKEAQEQLDAYISCWLKPVGANVWDQSTLRERFLEIWIALDVVARWAPTDERLKTLATVSPYQTPFFDALELWLQRRSLQVSVASQGIEFITEQLVDIRFEAVLALVIGGRLAKNDLLTLRAALQAPSIVPSSFQADAVLDAIQATLLCFETGSNQTRVQPSGDTPFEQ